jgi:hypothetical protein
MRPSPKGDSRSLISITGGYVPFIVNIFFFHGEEGMGRADSRSKEPYSGQNEPENSRKVRNKRDKDPRDSYESYHLDTIFSTTLQAK